MKEKHGNNGNQSSEGGANVPTSRSFQPSKSESSSNASTPSTLHHLQCQMSDQQAIRNDWLQYQSLQRMPQELEPQQQAISNLRPVYYDIYDVMPSESIEEYGDDVKTRFTPAEFEQYIRQCQNDQFARENFDLMPTNAFSSKRYDFVQSEQRF